MKNVNGPEVLRLLEKEIVINDCEILFDKRITSRNLSTLFEIHNSRWKVEGGWLTGINREETAGMAILSQSFPGDIILSFEGRTVPPSTHDINFMWNGDWSDKLNSCRNAYIGSICGWHDQRIGIERSPDYNFRITVPNPDFTPGKAYRITAGTINNTCFIFINDMLVLEADDPEPHDKNKYGRIGFTAWSSHIQVRDIVIRRARWTGRENFYTPEF